MARQPDAGKQEQWLELIQRWQRSQLTVRAFCDRYDLSEANFYVWRRVLRERGLLDDRSTAPPQRGSAFVKLTLAPEPAAASPVELVLNERRLLRVHPGFDPETLLQLVRLLEEPAC
jgi:transposase-like protein